MAPGNKVVSLQSQGAAGRFNLPSPLIRLRDVSGQRLREILSEFFDSSDDALFSMAEKAGSNQDQKAFFDAMRELRLRRKHITVSILQWVSRSFNEIGRFDPACGARELDGVDQDSLSLMDDEDLEKNVAIDNLIGKLRNRYKPALELLATRVGHLLPAIKLESRQMPLGPEVICSGLSEACGDLEIDIRAKLTVLKLFDQLLMNALEDLYNQANQLLIEEGVLPELKRPGAQKAASPKEQAYRNPPMTSRQASPARPADARTEAAMAGAQVRATFNELSALLHRDGASEHGGTHGGDVELDTQGLMAMLGNLQKPSAQWRGQSASSLSDQLNVIFRPDSGPAYAVKQVDSDVINLVSMLFDFILEDRQLAPTMKALIARLQIPVLKVALSDQSFFNRGGHPARKLLNELAMAAIGWVEKTDGQRDPLREKMESVVNNLLDNFTNNIELFSELLTDFSHFMDLDQRRRALVEQRLRDAEEGRAIQERAKLAVDELLTEFTSERELPATVATLLQEPWRKYLQWLILRKGESSPDWEGAVELTRRLVWSVDPNPIGESTRTELLRAIPGIVDGLREGLKTISWDPFATDNVIRDLELAHVDVFQRLVTAKAEAEQVAAVAEQAEAAVAEIPAPVAAVAEAVIEAPEPELPQAEVAVEPASGGVAEDLGDWLAKADALPVGSWVELTMNGNRNRCKLAAYIKATGKFIFVNRNGAKVAEFLREDLAGALAAGDISMLDDGLIFDRALESIIDNLRSNRRD